MIRNRWRELDVPDCKKFMETVDGIAESLGGTTEKESQDASAAAGLLDELSVGESKQEAASKEVPAVKAVEKLEVESKAEPTKQSEWWVIFFELDNYFGLF